MTNRKTGRTGTIFHKSLKISVALLALAMHTAFAEDAYIENSNGNQYFNTGHFIGPNTRIEKSTFSSLKSRGRYNHLACWALLTTRFPFARYTLDRR